MCQYTVLHHNEHGYVVKCNKCEHFQVAFGTTAISLSEDQFNQFREVISEKLEEADDGFPQQKNIHIPTMCQSICFIFSRNDLMQLNNLIENAHFTLEIEKLLTQHSIQSSYNEN